MGQFKIITMALLLFAQRSIFTPSPDATITLSTKPTKLWMIIRCAPPCDWVKPPERIDLMDYPEMADLKICVVSPPMSETRQCRSFSELKAQVDHVESPGAASLAP